MKETDLYPPLKTFLQGQQYEVKAEILDCDVMAMRGDEEPVVVELKLTLNLDVVLQAIDRQTMTSKVYIGIPADCKSFKKRRKQVTKLLKMLGLGLITIDPSISTGSVDVKFDPGVYKPRPSKRRRQRLLGEFVKRVGDPNLGGADKRKGIMTAYRQRALAIAGYLQTAGPTKASDVAQAINDAKSRDILYRNVYGWFERVDTGIYQLSPRGNKELALWTND